MRLGWKLVGIADFRYSCFSVYFMLCFVLLQARSSRSESPSSQDSHPKEFATEERARESSSDSETREDTPYEWTAMVSRAYKSTYLYLLRLNSILLHRNSMLADVISRLILMTVIIDIISSKLEDDVYYLLGRLLLH